MMKKLSQDQIDKILSQGNYKNEPAHKIKITIDNGVGHVDTFETSAVFIVADTGGETRGICFGGGLNLMVILGSVMSRHPEIKDIIMKTASAMAAYEMFTGMRPGNKSDSPVPKFNFEKFGDDTPGPKKRF